MAYHKQELPMVATLVVWPARNMAILFRIYHILFLQSNNALCLLGLFRIYHILFLQSNNSLCLLGLFRIYHTLFLQSNNSLCLLGLFRIYHTLFLQSNNFLPLSFGKFCRKIIIIDLDLGIHKIHIHTTPRINPTFCSQVVIRTPIWDRRMDVAHYYSPLRWSVGMQFFFLNLLFWNHSTMKANLASMFDWSLQNI